LIRLMVVDDHPVSSAGVAAALVESGGIEIVGIARSLAEIQPVVFETRPDVILCDIQLGNERALDVPRRLAEPAPPVVFFTSFDYPAYIRAALDAGAAGYLVKTAPLGDIVSAIRTVAAGGTAYAAVDLRQARGAPREPSNRELQVLRLVAVGRSNADIGAELAIDERTVESHMRRLFDRYGVDSRTELVAFCARAGWVDMSATDMLP
jgi:DNA-binding NarL/FixJ family response regulator